MARVSTDNRQAIKRIWEEGALMSVNQFFSGSGKISFGDQFISLRLIREALEKN